MFRKEWFEAGNFHDASEAFLSWKFISVPSSHPTASPVDRLALSAPASRSPDLLEPVSPRHRHQD
jgi:hypothetical protein